LRQSESALIASLQSEAETDRDLARVLAAWSTLPEPIRRAMLALIESAGR
jgi:hypothetical protein